MTFPLEGVRIVDLTWIIGGAGGPRLLAALGAQDIRVEWRDSPDTLRFLGATIPVGPDAERIAAGESLVPERVGTNQGGAFSEMNAGKLGVSLNLKHPEGRDLLRRLVAISDVVVENFSASKLVDLGLGYDELRAVNPGIVYVQQPGFGVAGEYTDFVSTAPVAEAITGLTHLAGVPGRPPSGWGYPFIDISASYYCAMAILGAVYHQRQTGEGQYVDCSLADPALYMTGTSLLDLQANGRHTELVGNRDVVTGAAPQGVFPCEGKDRWIAVTVADDEQWRSLAEVLDADGLASDERFATGDARRAHADEVDRVVAEHTRGRVAEELMIALQGAGVAAGVCQTARDRVEADAQLAHDRAFVPMANSEVGAWPVRAMPFTLARHEVSPGGTLGRGFPCYGEDNDFVYGELLGLSADERADLVARDVI